MTVLIHISVIGHVVMADMHAGEEQGKTYYFVSEDFFMSLVADNKMKEWGKNESNGCLYGTLSADYDGVPVSDELKKVYASSIPCE